MTLERRVVDLENGGGRRFCVLGPDMAIDFHVSDTGSFGPSAGLEMHYKVKPSYLSEQDEPFSKECWLTGVTCWGDGTSMYATDVMLPYYDVRHGKEQEEFFWEMMDREWQKRHDNAFADDKPRDATVPQMLRSMFPR